MRLTPLETQVSCRSPEVLATVYRQAGGEVICAWSGRRLISVTLSRRQPALRRRHETCVGADGRTSQWSVREFSDCAKVSLQVGLRPLRLDLEQLAPLETLSLRQALSSAPASRGVQAIFRWAHPVPMSDFLNLSFARPLAAGWPEAARIEVRLRALSVGPGGVILHRLPLPGDYFFHAEASKSAPKWL